MNVFSADVALAITRLGLLILLGWFMARQGWVGAHARQPLMRMIIWVFFPAMIFSGIAGAYLATVPGSLIGDVLKGKGGQVIALMQMSGDFAAMIAPVLLGAISDAGGFRPAFLLATLLMAAIVLMTTRIPETRNSVHHNQ